MSQLGEGEFSDWDALEQGGGFLEYFEVFLGGFVERVGKQIRKEGEDGGDGVIYDDPKKRQS